MQELVRLQTIEFKQEIEKRYQRCHNNRCYIFEREKNDSSDGTKNLYQDDSLDSLRNIGVYNLGKQISIHPKREKSIEKPENSKKTNQMLIRLLRQPKENTKSRSVGKNAPIRLRTEGSVLRESSRNMTLISPKVQKSPQYIQIESYLHSTKFNKNCNNYSLI